MTVRNTRTASLLAVGIAATFVSTLTPATAFAASGAPAAKSPLRPYTQQHPKWGRCDADSPAALQCATLKVPLDYGNPGGKQIDIAVSRVKATSTKERRGVLLFNQGGPGGPGLHMPVMLEADIPGKVKRQYDLVGFDPRGVGRSSPLNCGLTPDEQNFERPYKAETFAEDVKWARTVADKCRAKGGDKLRHLTTRNTARDMDVIRAVLGEKKLSYLGISYGTYLGAVYMQMFPGRADRFVLDSAVDPAQYGRGMFQGMAEGTEPAFTRWSRWTAQRHTTYKLGTTPAEVRKTFRDLIARAGRKPIDSDDGPLTGDDIRARRATFFRVQKAAEWVAGLKQAAEGKKPDRATADPAVPPASAQDGSADNEASTAWAVMCADTRPSWADDPEQYRRDAIRDKARYPLYGDFASNIKPCAFWKQGSEPATTVNNKAGALILQNEWDPATPLAGGRAMHRVLRGSRMITVADGEGHGVYGTNSCADRGAATYLTTGRLPAEDLTCRAPA
ncbi:alpha/beta fold hydrolase [Streptomyces sp. AV19]|uniref:alpha/beta hydrolase n=1 Tax=Streptomyces sp. AV19 TaxID=2793068 RepID=UPI0018FECF2C|nr:alpha/beta hydrolase [Streptomyces sp. AV19]MBH1934848.1 alpha/beta fold hydrolase [Streptomyces sp. AV19]MDG4536979.1 alpha/beta hydrolase [Streptomyces sp. AV19]